MMRRYLLTLLIATLALALASFAVMHFWPRHWLPVMPLMALYFGLTTLVQHWLVTRAMYKSPRAFVQQFLATTVGVLLLHLGVLAAWLLTHPQQARTFTVAFLVGFVASWIFETVSILLFVRNEKKKRESM